MLLKTILNRVQKQQGFVYRAVRLIEECRPGYDTLAPRRFEFVPLWGIPVFFLYAMRPCGAWRAGPVACASRPFLGRRASSS